MTTSIEIQIALDDLEFLKTNRYLLCFAETNSPIVWRCFSDYLADNPFNLIPRYEVFGTSSLNIGSKVTIDTNTMAIALGQQTRLDADAVFEIPVDGAAGRISVANQFDQAIYIGVSGALAGPDNIPETTPMIATRAAGPNVFITFTPPQTVQIWLQQNVATGSIIDPRVPNSIEVNLGKKDAARLLYQGGKWSEQSGARPTLK